MLLSPHALFLPVLLCNYPGVFIRFGRLPCKCQSKTAFVLLRPCVRFISVPQQNVQREKKKDQTTTGISIRQPAVGFILGVGQLFGLTYDTLRGTAHKRQYRETLQILSQHSRNTCVINRLFFFYSHCVIKCNKPKFFGANDLEKKHP